MKNYFIDQAFIFLASIITTIYAVMFQNKPLKRTLLLGKFLGAVIVAFFIMPAVMEYFKLTIKVTLLITVIVIYGFESMLKTAVKKINKYLGSDGTDISNH